MSNTSKWGAWVAELVEKLMLSFGLWSQGCGVMPSVGLYPQGRVCLGFILLLPLLLMLPYSQNKDVKPKTGEQKAKIFQFRPSLFLGPNNSIHLSLCASYSELITHFCNSLKKNFFFPFWPTAEWPKAAKLLCQIRRSTLLVISVALSLGIHQIKLWRFLVLPTLGKLIMKTTQWSIKSLKITLKANSCLCRYRDHSSLFWLS